jgi:hypothetical protein
VKNAERQDFDEAGLTPRRTTTTPNSNDWTPPFRLQHEIEEELFERPSIHHDMDFGKQQE